MAKRAKRIRQGRLVPFPLWSVRRLGYGQTEEAHGSKKSSLSQEPVFKYVLQVQNWHKYPAHHRSTNHRIEADYACRESFFPRNWLSEYQFLQPSAKLKIFCPKHESYHSFTVLPFAPIAKSTNQIWQPRFFHFSLCSFTCLARTQTVRGFSFCSLNGAFVRYNCLSVISVVQMILSDCSFRCHEWREFKATWHWRVSKFTSPNFSVLQGPRDGGCLQL